MSPSASVSPGATKRPTKPAAAPITVLAAAGNALQFDGTNDHVTFGAAPSLGLSTFTLEAWIRRTGTGATTTTSAAGGGGLLSVVPIVTKGRGEGDGTNVDMNWFLGIDTGTNRLAADFEEAVAGSGASGLNHSIIGNTAVTSNVWHHVAATYDGTWKLYLDGNLDGTLVVNEPPRNDSIQHAGIGTAMTSTGVAAGFFLGVIDEVRVWNVARTQAEIQASKDAELTSGTGLIGRWGMNEVSGTTVGNSIAGGVGGTALPAANPPTWVAGFDPPVNNRQTRRRSTPDRRGKRNRHVAHAKRRRVRSERRSAYRDLLRATVRQRYVRPDRPEHRRRFRGDDDYTLVEHRRRSNVPVVCHGRRWHRHDDRPDLDIHDRERRSGVGRSG